MFTGASNDAGKENDTIYMPFIVFFVFILLIILSIGGCCTMTELVVKMEKEAVNLGYAEHNQTTGDWQWITNK